MRLEMECGECGRVYPAEEMLYRCKICDYPLEVRYNYSSIAAKIKEQLMKRQERTIWRYRELLPIADVTKVVSMNEGGTPLHKSVRLARRLGIKNLYLKDETRNPTGSFKDRGSSVGVSKALEIGAAVGCVSTGNMAASLAAYAAKAGIKCVILLHAETPAEKIVPLLIYGAQVISLPKPYPEIYQAGLEISQEYGFYWVHSDAPMRVEGQKTCTYEISEQLGWQVPDKVIIPTSSGGNISAHWKGWKELHQMKVINKLPSMVVVQAEGCCPIVKAFKERKEEVEPLTEVKTIAHSISNPAPPSGRRVLRLLKECGGLAEAVSDKELLQAQKMLAETEGIFAEVAGAASIAGLKKLLERGLIKGEETVVCLVTGTGLKDIKTAMKTGGKTLKVESWAECRRALQAMKF